MTGYDQTPFHVNLRGVNLHLYEKVKTFETEVEVLDFIDQIKPGEVLFDIGACGGAFSLYAAKKGIEVWSFEPDPTNYQLLLDNIKRNPECGDRIHAINVAIGAKIRQERMSTNENKPGGHNKVLESANVRGRGPYENIVNVVTLDSLISKVVPDYMKIDVDGSEMNLALGAANMLKQPKLKQVMIELRKGSDFQKTRALLNDAGLFEKSRYLIERHLLNIVYGRK
jgi:FkbM family methyltransferase